MITLSELKISLEGIRNSCGKGGGSEWWCPQRTTIFEDEEGVASCPPGLTNALPYATSHVCTLRIWEPRGRLVVFSPTPLSHWLIQQMFIDYLYSLITSSAEAAMALGGSFRCHVERLWVTCMSIYAIGKFPIHEMGTERGSGYPGSSPDFAAPLNKSHPLLECPHKCYWSYHLMKL